MRQFTAIVALALVLATCTLALGQGIPSTAGRSFNYTSFTASDETHFSVQFNPIFGPQTLKLMFYDQFGGAERIEIGTVWWKPRVLLESFTTTFTVAMSNLSHTGVGNPDGFALVVQNWRNNAFGAGGGGLGYGATPDYYDLGVRRSVAIEFDTHQDVDLNDPNSNHVSIHTTTADRAENSAHEDAALTPPGAVTNIPPIAGFTHVYNIVYLNKELTLNIDGVQAFKVPIDINAILNLTTTGGFIGLTSACMGTCEDVEVQNWSFNYLSVVDATRTFVTNVRNSSTAGRASTFQVNTVDQNGYLYVSGGDASKISVSFTPVGGGTVTSPTVSVSDRGDGTYTVTYTPLASGDYDVTVYFNSQQISGMPFRIRVEPGVVDPSRSDVSLIMSGVAGATQNLTITARDSFNNINANNNPPSFFTATFTASGNAPLGTTTPDPARFTSTFLGNGVHLISYSLNVARTYSLAVTYNGTNALVKGSPFNGVTVTPSTPEATESYAVGAGTTGGTAGVPLPVTLVVRDKFRNNITAGIPPNYPLVGFWDKAAAGNNVTFVLQSDGTYLGNYAINTAGNYKLSISLGPEGRLIPGSPFPVTIVPDTVASPAQSVAFGSGTSSASAGINATFTVQARDAFGNNMTTSAATVTVSFSDDTGVPLNIVGFVSQNTANKALYTVSYTATQAVSTRVIVSMNGQQIKGSPFIVNVQPGPLDPKRCFAEGLGLVTPKTKVPLSFVVITADHYNNRLRTGGDSIAASLREQKSGATVQGTVSDLNNGAYNVGFTLTKSGVYNITITANGVPIGDNAKYSMIVPSEGIGALGWALIILGLLALVAVVGGGAFWYLKYYKARHEYDEIGA